MIARVLAATATALVISGLLVGCTQGADRSAEPSQNYVSGDGTVTEFPLSNRGDPIEFSGATDAGEMARSEDYLGDVLVVNFWYATCPPCRLEAPWLEELNQKYAADGVQFLGVNIRDGAETAQVFAEKFGITYPSIIDSDGLVTLAFSGLASPTAVPTTLVLDRDGTVASRIVGLLEKSTLDALIRTALNGTGEGGAD